MAQRIANSLEGKALSQESNCVGMAQRMRTQMSSLDTGSQEVLASDPTDAGPMSWSRKNGR